jgi:ABC-2 type transport system ATP-binding protein
MDEAEYCDRIALMYRGETIALDSPDTLKAQARTDECPDPSLEDAFIHLVQASEDGEREAA